MQTNPLPSANPKKLPGQLIRYATDVEQLSVEIVRPECLTFDFQITAGAITRQPQVTRCHVDYDFAVQKIRGYIQSPADNPANYPLISFQLHEDGRNHDWFITPINMGGLLSTTGPANDLEFDEPYIIRAGDSMRIVVTIAAGWAGGAKELGVMLIGNLVVREAK